jgi:hypothetical protein
LSRLKSSTRNLLQAGRGLLLFLVRGEADHKSWSAVLDMHCRSNGRSTDALTAIMRRLRPPPKPLQPFDSMLGHFPPNQVESIAEQIRRDGYFVFEGAIPAELCDEFVEASKLIEARTSRNPDEPKQRARFDPSNPIGYVYDLPEPDVWKLPSAQKFLADPIFLSVSQAYFRCAPVLKDLNVWWSAVLGGKPDSNSAQVFHFDYDAAPIWLKFFIYMTDVDAETGPHVYVRGSHRMQQPRMREILSRGYVRISDQEIAEVFGPENIKVLTGRKGTVIAVDTLGYHKGKAPQSGARLVAQLEFATALFAKSVTEPVSIPRNIDPGLSGTMKANPGVFRRYRQEAPGNRS